MKFVAEIGSERISTSSQQIFKTLAKTLIIAAEKAAKGNGKVGIVLAMKGEVEPQSS